MREFHKLEPGQIVLGASLRWDIFDTAGNLLLRKGYVVGEADQADELVERGMYVDAAEYLASLEGREPPYDPFHIIASVTANISFLLADPPRDGSLQGEIEKQAERVAWVAEHSPDTALAAMQLAEQRNYPATHAFYTAVMADMLAQRIGWDDNRRISTLCAALTMNMGMHSLQQTLFKQRSPLNSEQQATIDKHPTQEARLLIECGINDDEWVRAVLEHHERPDGSGYPRKIRNTSEIARLLQVCDNYTAMLSDRTYRARVVANEAIKQIFTTFTEASGNPFGSLLAHTTGLFPPGTLVKLANGELGVVFLRSAQPKCPQVATLVDAKGLRCAKPQLRQTSEEGLGIVAVIPQEKSMIAVPLEKIWHHKAKD